MYLYKTRYDSPLGSLTLVADGEALIALTLPGQRLEERHLPAGAAEERTPLLAQACEWLDAYFLGRQPQTIPFPLSPEGTAYQLRVWNALREVPYGKTVSYGDLAKLLSSSARAVGSAVGRNPISILIPCHRVLGADGRLTGYAGGLAAKQKLLNLEASGQI